MQTAKNYYETLGVDVKASREQIRAKYHELALLYHPDRAKHKEMAHQIFVQINQAYCTLIDPEKRARYDEKQVQDRYRRATQSPISSAPAQAAPAPTPASAEEIKQWMNEANNAFLRGELETAHDRCRRTIKAGNAPVEAYILIGDVYLGQREKTKALGAYRFALNMQPDNKMLQAKVKRLEMVDSASTGEVRNGAGGVAAGKPSSNGVHAQPAVKISILDRFVPHRTKKPPERH